MEEKVWTPMKESDIGKTAEQCLWTPLNTPLNELKDTAAGKWMEEKVWTPMKESEVGKSMEKKVWTPMKESGVGKWMESNVWTPIKQQFTPLDIIEVASIAVGVGAARQGTKIAARQGTKIAARQGTKIAARQGTKIAARQLPPPPYHVAIKTPPLYSI